MLLTPEGCGLFFLPLMHCDAAPHHTTDIDVAEEKEGLEKGTGGRLEYFSLK